MSWMQKLFETYEACSQNPAYTEPPQAEDGSKETPALMPVSHTSQQAHICVTLDAEGNFIRAELMPLKKQLIIPATEGSAGRAGAKVAPHPLIDKVHYCAGDYKGKKSDTFAGAFEAYLELLTAWDNSDFSHPVVFAVRTYVAKKHLVKDLIAAKILFGDDPEELLTTPQDEEQGIFKYISKDAKTKQYDQGDAVVCWKVLNDSFENRSWSNKNLQENWISFESQLAKKTSLCMVSGNTSAFAQNHPRNIRRPGDGAKLISSNDSSNFTYRGRFLEPEQACTVGYEVSHKAHNALRWLIARQGYRNGEQAVVAWAVSGARVPNPCEDLFDLDDEAILQDALPSESADSSKDTQPADAPVNMGVAFANRLRKALAGFKADLKDTDGIAIMAMDAASPGRLSVTFYREHMLKDYLSNLEKWQEDCAWVLPVRIAPPREGQEKAKSRTVYMAIAPTPETIARVAYGKRIDDKLRKATIERLLPCVVDANQLPRDIVESCVRRACNRAALEGWEWNEVLGVACAVFKGYFARHNQKEEYSMALDETRNTRDYLFGRLLAVAEYIERAALDSAGEKRPTNAERLMQRFADHPFATWRQLEVQLQPYIQRLKSSSRAGLLVRAQKAWSNAYDKFVPEEFSSSSKLSGEFLLGYHCQQMALYSKTDKENTSEVTD